jgi:integrase/recombinase XerD
MSQGERIQIEVIARHALEFAPIILRSSPVPFANFPHFFPAHGIIRGTKFFKTRIVPLGTSLNTVMKAFVAKHCSRYSKVGGSVLFSKRDGTPLTDSAISAAFRRLRTIAGIKRDGGARNQPRIHDFRHSAAVHRVTSWYRVGADLNDLLPKLATYLGHKDLSGTQRYLTMTEELLAEASRRFEAFAQGGGHV